MGKQLKMGLTLVLDLNEERQINFNDILKNDFHYMESSSQDDASSFSLFVDTISI